MKNVILLEKGIDLSDVPKSYIAKPREISSAYKKYYKAVKDVKDMMLAMDWQEIDLQEGNGRYTPVFPEAIRNKIAESKTIFDQVRREVDRKFSGGSSDINQVDLGKWNPGQSHTYFTIDGSDRSHLPSGIPTSLRGLGLGFKLYRSLIQKKEYVVSALNASRESQAAWQSVIKERPDPDDVHVIVSKARICAIVKNISDTKKVRYVRKFITNIRVEEITEDNFKMDDGLKSILPDDIKMQLDPARREEARREREAREQEERDRRAREQAARVEDRLRGFGVTDINDHSWEIGDFIVLKQYALQEGFEPMPIRMVVAKSRNVWYALKLPDAFRYIRDRNYGLDHDNRTTREKNAWTKIDINRASDERVPREVRDIARSENPIQTIRQQATQAASTNDDTPAPAPINREGLPSPVAYQPRYLKSSARPFPTRGIKSFIKKFGNSSQDRHQEIFFNPIQLERVNSSRPTEVSLYHLSPTAQNGFWSSVSINKVEGENTTEWLSAHGWRKAKLERIDSKTDVRRGQAVYIAGSHRTLYGMVAFVDNYLLNNRDEEYVYVNIYDSNDDGGVPRKVYIRTRDIRKIRMVGVNESIKVPRFSDFSKQQ